MATIPELLDGHVTLEVECVDRLYLNGYIGKLATGPGLSMFMRFQLEKSVPSPVVLGQVSERFRNAVKTQAEREGIPVYEFQHKERKDDIANHLGRQRQVRDGIRANPAMKSSRPRRCTRQFSTAKPTWSVCCWIPEPVANSLMRWEPGPYRSCGLW